MIGDPVVYIAVAALIGGVGYLVGWATATSRMLGIIRERLSRLEAVIFDGKRLDE